VVPTLKYTVMRLGLFVAALGLLYLVGARGVLAVGLAVVVSALLAFVLLRNQRDAVAGQVSQRLQRRLATRRPASADEQLEDAAAEQLEPGRSEQGQA
jgi:Protein of unknown function (DUF4229)